MNTQDHPTPRATTRRGVRSGWARPELLALPAVAFLALFFYVPLGRVFADAFDPSTTDGIRPIIKTLGDPYFWHLLRFTTLQAVYSALGSLVIGFPLGYILANRSFRGRRLLQSATLVPFVLPSVAVALGFLVFFGHNGVVNRVLLETFGFRLQILYSVWGIVLAHAFYNAPIVARTVHAAWAGLDPSYEEAARSLGAPAQSRLRTIILPLILPGVISGTLMAFIFAFFSFSIVLALGGSRFATLEVAIYSQVRVLLNYSNGAALAMLQTCFSLIAAYIYLGVERRFLTEVPGGRSRGLPALRQLTPANVALWLYLLFLTVFYAGPILAVFYDSLRGLPDSLSLKAYKDVLFGGYDQRLGDTPSQALRNSLAFATGALVIALPLGALLSFALAQWGKRGRSVWNRWYARITETMGLAPLAVSSVAFGFAALRAYRIGPLQAVGLSPESAIIIAHAVLAIPFILRTLRPTFEQIDSRYVEAARSLGATRRRAFSDIELPLATAGLIVGAALGFTLSLTEMSATIMLARPGLMTLPLSVYHHLAARNFSAAAAMSMILIVLTAVALVGLEALARRITRGR